VDDPLLMGVLDGLADRHEQLQPLPGRQVIVVAVPCDGDAVDQFHDEEGPAGFSRAGFEDLGDVDMVHHGQGLPLRFEAGHDLGAVHAELDDLQGDLAADGLFLLGHVDDTHATLADLLKQLVRPDATAGAFDADRRVGRPSFRRRHDRSGGLFAGAVGLVGLKQGLDRPAQHSVGAARPIEVGPALRGRGDFEGGQEDLVSLGVRRAHERTSADAHPVSGPSSTEVFGNPFPLRTEMRDEYTA
jgi:hypothetical protein